MNLFTSPQEKGSGEWKSIGEVLREKRADLYPTARQRVVHLHVRPAATLRRQFFVLKDAH
ncbi:MAG TPA: hypothetical protein VMH91_01075 [Candidatus Paceibacterota bacterium]|nr:hypothetical protein [Candidatus Paceibacterota bacterium]